ncbi:HindIII family type II restriction endonuclease [Staphylococcus haemolyticus]|uniref:HindIII family type II restriction endonuclease n=1 Tax=Staphylococcus haemolyticus TaxID=1283 RepID=UPI002884CE74|nr:HindIII family type II restriction endonuclease [Staphylococcus haemolyticus]MDT0738737.1 HindIII family type II restriction endonuclease [Staphylococcus haemolyticus]
MATQFIEKFIDNLVKPYNTDEIVDIFDIEIKKLTIDEITDIILSDIYIPDYYNHDSSEETLFTKLVEVITSFVFEKLEVKSEYLKTKSATEDIHLVFNEKEEPLHVVGDVKTYRLGRSQKAANVKDFVKPADFKDIWGKKYENSCGLVVFPSTHEWSTKSDVYQHCTNPDYPIVMMHYSHLAVLLNSVENRNLDVNFESLWDYSDLEQSEINRKDKNNYWTIFNRKFDKLFYNDTIDLANSYEETIQNNIKEIVVDYEEMKTEKIEGISKKVNEMNESELRQLSKQLLTDKEVKKINTDIQRIKKFRITK